MTASNLCLCLSLSLPLLFSFSPFLSDLLSVSKDHPPIYLKSNHNGIGFSNLLNLDRNVLPLRFPPNNIGGSCYLPPNIKPRSINYTQSMLHEYIEQSSPSLISEYILFCLKKKITTDTRQMCKLDESACILTVNTSTSLPIGHRKTQVSLPPGLAQ